MLRIKNKENIVNSFYIKGSAVGWHFKCAFLRVRFKETNRFILVCEACRTHFIPSRGGRNADGVGLDRTKIQILDIQILANAALLNIINPYYVYKKFSIILYLWGFINFVARERPKCCT
jgi:hypothetical protein